MTTEAGAGGMGGGLATGLGGGGGGGGGLETSSWGVIVGTAPRAVSMASSPSMAAVTFRRPPVITLSAPSATLSTDPMMRLLRSAYPSSTPRLQRQEEGKGSAGEMVREVPASTATGCTQQAISAPACLCPGHANATLHAKGMPKAALPLRSRAPEGCCLQQRRCACHHGASHGGSPHQLVPAIHKGGVDAFPGGQHVHSVPAAVRGGAGRGGAGRGRSAVAEGRRPGLSWAREHSWCVLDQVVRLQPVMPATPASHHRSFRQKKHYQSSDTHLPTLEKEETKSSFPEDATLSMLSVLYEVG